MLDVCFFFVFKSPTIKSSAYRHLLGDKFYYLTLCWAKWLYFVLKLKLFVYKMWDRIIHRFFYSGRWEEKQRRENKKQIFTTSHFICHLCFSACAWITIDKDYVTILKMVEFVHYYFFSSARWWIKWPKAFAKCACKYKQEIAATGPQPTTLNLIDGGFCTDSLI